MFPIGIVPFLFQYTSDLTCSSRPDIALDIIPLYKQIVINKRDSTYT